jgi:hypothetical protein
MEGQGKPDYGLPLCRVLREFDVPTRVALPLLADAPVYHFFFGAGSVLQLSSTSLELSPAKARITLAPGGFIDMIPC